MSLLIGTAPDARTAESRLTGRLRYLRVEEPCHHVDHCGPIIGGRTGQAEEIDQPEPVADDASEEAECRVETIFVHQALLPRLEHIGSRTKFAITGRI